MVTYNDGASVIDLALISSHNSIKSIFNYEESKLVEIIFLQLLQLSIAPFTSTKCTSYIRNKLINDYV